MDAIFLFFFGFVFIFSLGLTHSFIYGFIITISIFFIFGLISKQMEASKKVSKEARWKREKEEEQRKQKEEQLKLEEKRKQLIEEKRPRDIKEYHRIINCPLCEGNGKAYIKIDTEKYQNGQEEITLYLSSRNSYDWHQNNFIRLHLYDKSYDCALKLCPYCKGEGIAYAWYGKIVASKIKCDQCQGSGQITTKIKLEIGMGDKKITCAKCNGIGSFQVPEKSVVHVKTKSGGINEDSVEGKCEEGEKIGDYPKRFILEITKDNKELLEKSKPRTS
ncbi:MAG: hypothetical protein WCK96_08770 [Methylococcales bacterium]